MRSRWSSSRKRRQANHARFPRYTSRSRPAGCIVWFTPPLRLPNLFQLFPLRRRLDIATRRQLSSRRGFPKLRPINIRLLCGRTLVRIDSLMIIRDHNRPTSPIPYNPPRMIHHSKMHMKPNFFTVMSAITGDSKWEDNCARAEIEDFWAVELNDAGCVLFDSRSWVAAVGGVGVGAGGSNACC